MTTNTKSVIEKNQRALLRWVGGQKNFVSYMNMMLRHDRYGNVWRQVKELLQSSYGPIDYWSMYDYLKRTIPHFDEKVYLYKNPIYGEENGISVGKTGYKPKMNKDGSYTRLEVQKMDKWANPVKIEQTYYGMMCRDGAKLYEKLIKAHPEWA